MHVREQVGGPWLAPDMTTAVAAAAAAADKKDGKKKKTRKKEEEEEEEKGEENGDGDGGVSFLSLATMLTMSSSTAVASGGDDDPYWLPGGIEDRHAALHAAVATLRVLSKPAARTSCAGEILAPVRAAAERLTATLSGGGGGGGGGEGKNTKKNNNKKKAPPPPPAAAPVVLSGALAAAAASSAGLEKDIASALSGALRAPLAWRTKKAEAIKQFNPMYEEEGYQKGRDYDPNRERAEARRLQRQLKQEARGAVRELRKDNRFLAEQRAEEAAAAADERGERQQETMAFLEKLEGDMKSGGQGGMVVKTQRRVNGGSGRDRKKR